MPAIKVVNLSKTYRVGRQAVPAVHGVTLDVPDGKIVTLLGPSGCGKSTTLRCIAGLERPDEGEIFFDQRPLFSRARGVAVPPAQRNVGMVFQSYAIWPHLTVFQNVAYPLQVRRLPAKQIAERVRETLALVGLSGQPAGPLCPARAPVHRLLPRGDQFHPRDRGIGRRRGRQDPHRTRTVVRSSIGPGGSRETRRGGCPSGACAAEPRPSAGPDECP